MQTKSNRGLFVVAAVALIGVGALGYYVGNQPREVSEPYHPSGANVETSKPSPTPPESQPTTEPVTPKTPPHEVDQRVQAVERTLLALNLNGAVSVRSITIDHRVARIDFTPTSNLSFGSQDESQFLKGLRQAMGAFSDVDAIELYQGGQKVDELGHEVLDAPLPVIRETSNEPPGAAQTTSQGN